MKKGKVMDLKEAQVLSSQQMKQVIGGQTYSSCAVSCSFDTQCRLSMDSFGYCQSYLGTGYEFRESDSASVPGEWVPYFIPGCTCSYRPN